VVPGEQEGAKGGFVDFLGVKGGGAGPDVVVIKRKEGRYVGVGGGFKGQVHGARVPGRPGVDKTGGGF
jgi:hypothetical protein